MLDPVASSSRESRVIDRDGRLGGQRDRSACGVSSATSRHPSTRFCVAFTGREKKIFSDIRSTDFHGGFFCPDVISWHHRPVASAYPILIGDAILKNTMCIGNNYDSSMSRTAAGSNVHISPLNYSHKSIFLREDLVISTS